MDSVASRVQSVEEYLKSLVGSALDEFAKGEWLAVVRTKLRDMA